MVHMWRPARQTCTSTRHSERDSNMATSVEQKAMVSGTMQGFKRSPICLDASRALRHHQHPAYPCKLSYNGRQETLRRRISSKDLGKLGLASNNVSVEADDKHT